MTTEKEKMAEDALGILDKAIRPLIKMPGAVVIVYAEELPDGDILTCAASLKIPQKAAEVMRQVFMGMAQDSILDTMPNIKFLDAKGLAELLEGKHDGSGLDDGA